MNTAADQTSNNFLPAQETDNNQSQNCLDLDANITVLAKIPHADIDSQEKVTQVDDQKQQKDEYQKIFGSQQTNIYAEDSISTEELSVITALNGLQHQGSLNKNQLFDLNSPDVVDRKEQNHIDQQEMDGGNQNTHSTRGYSPLHLQVRTRQSDMNIGKSNIESLIQGHGKHNTQNGLVHDDQHKKVKNGSDAGSQLNYQMLAGFLNVQSTKYQDEEVESLNDGLSRSQSHYVGVSNGSSETSSPLKRENTFSNRTKDFRSNLKGQLKLGLDRSRFQSASSLNSSVINLETLNAEEIQKMEMDSRDQFEQKYIEGKFIGEGCSAVVKECVNRETEKKYAVKIMRNLDEERVNAARNEFDLLSSLRQSNIVRVKEFFVTHKQIYMIMELVDGQELMDRISEIEKYDENIAKKLFRQALKAIKYLHENGICHRDIKPSNILVLNGKEKIKITDFNISKLCKNKSFQMLTHTGTESFSAPEMYTSEVYNEKIDLWSAGCVLYTMLAGYQPFFENNANKLYKMIQEGNYDLEGDPWQDISDKAKDLVKKLLTVDPEQRISAAEALNHPWIKVEEDKPQTLQTVVNRMNQRKSIRMLDTPLNKLAENLYPNIDYSQIYKNLVQNGLDPIGQTRDRIMTLNQNPRTMKRPTRPVRKLSDSSQQVESPTRSKHSQESSSTNPNNSNLLEGITQDNISVTSPARLGRQLSNIDEISDRSQSPTKRSGSILEQDDDLLLSLNGSRRQSLVQMIKKDSGNLDQAIDGSIAVKLPTQGSFTLKINKSIQIEEIKESKEEHKQEEDN